MHDRPNAPIEIATLETVEFLASALPPPARILEVGCGEGHVAAGLAHRGYEVMGIDADPVAVAKARWRGVSAKLASWPDCEVIQADAVAFTRSLHHLHSLHESLVGAREQLRPSGMILVEDFAFEEADETTIRWFAQVLRSSRAGGFIDLEANEFAVRLLKSADPVAAWRDDHDHELHSIKAMTDAVSRGFADLRTANAPYLYRYLVPVIPATPDAAEFVAEVLQSELQLGREGRIVLIGRRLKGTMR